MTDDANHVNANLSIGACKDASLRTGACKNANREIGGPGWHSRGYLPHFEGAETIQHVTFHLADSLPSGAVRGMEEELRMVPAERQDVERRKRVEAWIDSGHGCCVLREPSIGRMVEGAFLFFDGQRYRLLAWVVMPNHVHVMFQPMGGWSVAKIVASWKKFTAMRICAFWRLHGGNGTRRTGDGEEANREIGDPGPVWHREYWDRYMRNERHFRQAVEYIHQNPVKAGLVEKPEDWPWGSARFGGRGMADGKNANREIGGPGSPGSPGGWA